MNQQIQIKATYMRGGTSKGVFFALNDLPTNAQSAGSARDNVLLRVIGSPDPFAKHTDGMGGATSSTSKVVIISKSEHENFDVNYLFGQVAINKAHIDWSGNCGNLTAAVGSFAINNGLVDKDRIPHNGVCSVRIWQENIGKTIIAHVPIVNGTVQELGDFELDGVTFPSAEVTIDFLQPIDTDSLLFPSGNLKDTLTVPDVGRFTVTIINAGIPTVFVHAHELGYTGCELQPDINNDSKALQMFETIRAHAALTIGLIDNIEQAKQRQHTPKIALVAPPKDYTASSGKAIHADDIDLNVRALSMGQLHHAMMGTVAVSIASAASIPGTIVNDAEGGTPRNNVTFGHPSGTLRVAVESEYINDTWNINKVTMSRSARRLMEGVVYVPEDVM